MRAEFLTRITAASVLVAILILTIRMHASQSAGRNGPIPLQPLAQQAHQIENALAYLGEPLSAEEVSRIDEAVAVPDESKAVEQLQSVLDSHVLAIVEINSESRVKFEAGVSQSEVVEAGTRLFLIKIINDAGVTARL